MAGTGSWQARALKGTVKRHYWTGVFRALAGLTAGSAAIARGAPAARLGGTASGIDGDTIEIHGERLRLSGIDMPERGRRRGSVAGCQNADLALSDMIGSRTVSSVIPAADR